MADDALINSMMAAVRAAPGDGALRLHLAQLLIDAGRGDEAVEHAAAVVASDPTNADARATLTRAVTGASPAVSDPVVSDPVVSDPVVSDPASTGFDWQAAESEVKDLAPPPMFASGDPKVEGAAYSAERAGLTLADVGGMTDAKKRIYASFLAPLRNEELRSLYGKSLRGGLLLYGPPGCGKTFLARAVAGELGAGFMSVSLADILGSFFGESESNVAELFAQARASAPCVLFLDEVDAIGHRRSQVNSTLMRGAINQLLTELDGVQSTNDGVFVLAATNHPWDIDPALLRPGRFDRMVLVLPPDFDARVEILRYHFARRPIAGIDLNKIAKATDGFSGADLAFLVDNAAELALMDSVQTGHVRLIEMADVMTALNDIRPSVGPWMNTARNVVTYADPTGQYAELAKYIRKHHRS